MKNTSQSIHTKVLNIILTVSLAIAFLPIVPRVEAQAEETEQALELVDGTYDETQIIVKFKDSVESESTEAVLESADSVKCEEEASVEKIDENIATVKVEEDKSVADAIEELTCDPRVEYAEPDYIATLCDDVEETANLQTTSVNDPLVSSQWYITDENAKVQDAWDIAKCDGNVSIAYIDSGIDTDHPDLAGNIIASYHTAGNSVQDNYGHGTAVAGVLSAKTNNSTGVSGVSYNANLVPVKAFEGVNANLSEISSGIKWVIDNKEKYNIKVINMSFGFKLGKETTDTKTLTSYINEATDAGILCVCASGNNYTTSGVTFPASIDCTIAVGAIDSNHARASFSNGGSNLDVVAPGKKIYTTINGGGYANEAYFGKSYSESISGTSFSCPFVAATAALCFAVNGNATPAQVKNCITSTAKDLGESGKDVLYGYGQVVVKDAVEKAKSTASYEVLYRAYNPYTGEHLFTNSLGEYNSITSIGWRKEGVAWKAPVASGSIVYRLYNPYSGDHHYTTDKSEYDKLATYGWKQEGTAWRSASSSDMPVYRLYNQYVSVGTHHYTTSLTEYNSLVQYGWKQEGTGWYGLN